MHLIVGLGNPGKKYSNTRHNVGFLVLDELARVHGLKFKSKSAVQADIAEGEINGTRVILCKPQTFMNASGRSVSALLKKNPITPRDVSVVYDDADLKFGDLREKLGGSSAGHRGIDSLMTTCGNASKEFHKVRFGIGRPSHLDIKLEDFVLQTWTEKEHEQLPECIKNAQKVIEDFVQESV